MIILHFYFRCISKDNFKSFNRRTGMPFLSEEYKAFENHIRWDTKSQYKGKILKGDLEIYLKAYFKDKRHCDITNLFKGTMDALQGIVFENDRQIKRATVEVFYIDRDEFRVMVNERS